MNRTLSNANVLSICLLAIVWIAETSLLLSWQDITTGVCNRVSSSLNGLKKETNPEIKIQEETEEIYDNKSIDSLHLITCNAQ